jgi:hypothetical protein
MGMYIRESAQEQAPLYPNANTTINHHIHTIVQASLDGHVNYGKGSRRRNVLIESKYVHEWNVCTKPKRTTASSLFTRQAVSPKPPLIMFNFDLKSDNANTSTFLHDGANTGRRVNSVLIGRRESTLLSDLGGAVGEDVVLLDRKALLVRIQVCDNSLVDVGERVGFNKDLSAHARVHTRDAARVAGTVDVAGTEPDRGQA